MEIIATGEHETFFIQIEKYELEKLTGYYYDKHRFKIGENICVDALYDQLKELTRQEAAIKKMAHSLKTAAGMLEKINPIFIKQEDKDG